MTRRIWLLYLAPFIIIIGLVYGLFVLSTQADDRHRLPASATDEAIAAQIHQENIVITVHLQGDDPLNPPVDFRVKLIKKNPSGDLEEIKATDAMGRVRFTVSPSTTNFELCLVAVPMDWRFVRWEPPADWVGIVTPPSDSDSECFAFGFGPAVPGYPETGIIKGVLDYIEATMTPPPTSEPLREYQEFTPQERLSMAIVATHELFDKEPCVLCQPAVVPVTIPVVFDWGDQTLYAGMYEEDLGAPLTRGLLLEGEDGKTIVFRAFAGGMIAIHIATDGAIPDPSIKQWGVIAWNGRLNMVEDSEREVRDLIWEQLN